MRHRLLELVAGKLSTPSACRKPRTGQELRKCSRSVRCSHQRQVFLELSVLPVVGVGAGNVGHDSAGKPICPGHDGDRTFGTHRPMAAAPESAICSPPTDTDMSRNVRPIGEAEAARNAGLFCECHRSSLSVTRGGVDPAQALS
jgi:hypothetical protein